MELLKKLCETSAIPGREQKLIDLMQGELKKTCDSVSVDSMGNVVGVKKSAGKNAKNIMISAHMDEIGFIVSHIDNNGFIRVAPRGYHMPRTLCSQRVRILGKKEIVGVAETNPSRDDPKKRDEVPKVTDMFIDTGLGKAAGKSVSVGDIVVLERSFLEQGDVCISKAFDDRIGCFVLVEAMKRVQNKKLPVNIYAVGSTQEEVGLRGARGAAKEINPDIGIALDVTSACDVPGVGAAKQTTAMGKGVAIKINDSAAICNHGIVKYLQSLASKHKIKHQMEILAGGGTDSGAMQMFGRGAVCALSIPTRYVHSPSEMISKKDLKAGIDLLVRFLETADKCKLEF